MDQFPTSSVIERLAVVETLTAETRNDVSEIKSDVKALLHSNSRMSGIGVFIVKSVSFLAMVFAGASLAITVLSKGFI